MRAAALFLLLSGYSIGQKLEVDLVPEAMVQSRLDAGLVKLRQRQDAIETLFRDVGCSPETQTINKHVGNVICTLPGQTAETIVVGGHLDFIEAGKGIVDDWSGAALLPTLYQSLQSRPHRHTYVFAAFANEEVGLVGSSYYVKNLTPQQKPLIRAFVNLECLGLSTAKVWESRASPALLTPLKVVASAMHLPLQGVNVEQIGDDDTHPFLSAKLPVITIHSLTQETLRVLHSPGDRMDAIHFHDYYDEYKLAAYYLAYLDLKLE